MFCHGISGHIINRVGLYSGGQKTDILRHKHIPKLRLMLQRSVRLEIIYNSGPQNRVLPYSQQKKHFYRKEAFSRHLFWRLLLHRSVISKILWTVGVNHAFNQPILPRLFLVAKIHRIYQKFTVHDQSPALCTIWQTDNCNDITN